MNVFWQFRKTQGEIGIILAPGAVRSRVLGMMLREAAVLVSVGLALGLAAAILPARGAANLDSMAALREELTTGAMADEFRPLRRPAVLGFLGAG